MDPRDASLPRRIRRRAVCCDSRVYCGSTLMARARDSAAIAGDQEDEYMADTPRRTSLNLLATVAVLVVLGACAQTLPSLQTGPDAVVSPEGLHKIDNSAFELAFARPGVDFSQYDKFILEPLQIASNAAQVNSETGSRSRRERWEFDARGVERLKGEFRDAIVEALEADRGYPIVTEPAPGVLRIVAAIVTIDMPPPPQRTGVRGEGGGEQQRDPYRRYDDPRHGPPRVPEP